MPLNLLLLLGPFFVLLVVEKDRAVPLYLLYVAVFVPALFLWRRMSDRRRDFAYVAAGWPYIDLMPGTEFENYVGARLRTAGWKVTTTAASGDYGVDLIAAKGQYRVAVQCKRFGKPVGVSAVQEVVAGALHYGCWASMVVSNQEFTTNAKRLAATHQCELVGRSRLMALETVMPQV